MMGTVTMCSHMPGSEVEGFICIVHLIPMTALLWQSAQENLKAQRDKVTCLRLHCKWGLETKYKPHSVALVPDHSSCCIVEARTRGGKEMISFWVFTLWNYMISSTSKFILPDSLLKLLSCIRVIYVSINLIGKEFSLERPNRIMKCLSGNSFLQKQYSILKLLTISCYVTFA